MATQRPYLRILIDLVAVLAIALILAPQSLTAVISQIGIDPHPVSFWLAPMLYQFGHHLLPGVDYMTQYGIGYGALLYPLLKGMAPVDMVLRSTGLQLAIIGGFYLSYYLVAARFLRSRLWALSTMLFVLLLNFYGQDPMRSPSAWPVRYPLLMVFCFLCAANLRSPTPLRGILLGISIGAGFFLNSESGLFMGVAAVAVTSLALPRFPTALRSILMLGASAVLTFYALSLAAYGPGVLSPAFLRGLIEPFLIYGGGFGAWLVNWSFSVEMIFDLAVPILLAASVGWAIHGLRRRDETGLPREELSYVVVLSSIGILMLLKWVNMSLTAVWFSSAHAPILVGVFWLRRLMEGQELRESRAFKWIPAVGPLALAGLALLFLLVYSDPRMACPYGLRSWWFYPSWLKGVIVGSQAPRSKFDLFQLSDRDVALIRENSAPGEPVAIVSNFDYAYLMAAQRPPKFGFLPSTMTMFTWQLDRSLAGARIIFMDRSPQKWGWDTAFSKIVEDKLSQDYQFIKTGERLSLYVKNTGNASHEQH